MSAPAPSFAGTAGEVMLDLVRPSALPRILPGLGASLGLACGALALGTYGIDVPLAGVLVLVVASQSPVLGRLALRERFHEAPVLLETASFVLRFAIPTAVWGVPLVLLAPNASKHLAWPAGPLAPEGWSTVIAVCAGATALLVVLSTTTALAATCDSLREVVAPYRWRTVFVELGASLPALWTGVAGAVALAYGVTLPVSLALASLLVAIDAYAGIVCSLVGYLLPLAVGTVACGRLGGAFARAADLRAAEAYAGGVPAEAVATSGESAAASPPAHRPLPPPFPTGPLPEGLGVAGAEVMEFIRAFQSLPRKAEADLGGAILEGESLHRRQPTSAGVLAELAKLYRRAGRDDDAIGAASRAITVAINFGTSPVAVEVYRSFVAQRDRFELDATTFDRLARVLHAQGCHEDAQWCAERATDAS